MLITLVAGVGWCHASEEACAAALEGGPPPPFEGTPAERAAAFEEAVRLLESAPWTFAKTMPTIPHEWTLRRQWGDSDAFTLCVLRIKQFGLPRKFRSKSQRKLFGGQFFYWVMDALSAPPECSMLINRAVTVQYETDPLPFPEAR